MSKAAERGSKFHDGLMARLERRGWAAPTILTVGLLLAVALRGLTLYVAPWSGYLDDHLSFMSWSERAVAHGPTALYDVIDETRINAKVMVDLDGHWQIHPLPTVARVNYPPLACNIFWLQGALWHWLDAVVVTTHPSPTKSAAIRETPAVVTSHLANTPLARFVNAFPAMMTELLMAWGVALLVRVHCRKPGARVAQSLAFVLTLNAPPIILDSAHWSQTDA